MTNFELRMCLDPLGRSARTRGRGGTIKQFVSEPISPVGTSFDAVSMSTGEPGLPARFTWRGTEYEVAQVLHKWKTTGPCHHGSGEQYVRRHWFRLVTTDGTRMEIYFDRQARSRQNKQRWWLAAVFEEAEDRPVIEDRDET